MKHFLLLLRANIEMKPEAFTDPKEIESRLSWLEKIKNSGTVVDLGGTLPPTPLMGATIFADGSIISGAFKEVSHFLTGYLVLQAESLENALELAKDNPILVAGGSIELREIITRIKES
ncbi:YciI family protein [Acinetobacter sp. ANC 3832]|uniref:YciI family protein n=1 Tax=Acinetobacter sp. ANC 3832 TaxID=1977874 RepID=UPI000A342FAA|nr:YciI family protein [Acinetobacter sp. ANC 3832]OTG94980.1 hypothetical protein B9T35_06360 [Acinetobacter sp. ANC 3832]